MRFKLRQMEVFRAVMLTGSVSGAARLLYVSQPAVSKLLAHTETSLGLQLFQRVGGKLVPTPQAQTLFEEVRQVYDAALRVDRFVENLAAGHTGQINVSSSPSLGLAVVPRLIQAFQARYPSARVHFHTTLIHDVPLELLSGKADLAITVLPVENPNLSTETLMRGRMVCAVPRAHRYAERACLSLAELVDERVILYSRNIPFGQLMLAAFERYDCPITPVIDVPRAELACALVRQGAGIALVDEFSVSGGLWQDLQVVALAETIPIAVSLVRSRLTPPTALGSAFAELARERLKGEAAAG